MSRTVYRKLQTYNSVKKGNVQGPAISNRIPSMALTTPLYSTVDHGYNSLTFDGSAGAYYKIDNGPYAQSCSLNKYRGCRGGPPKGNVESPIFSNVR